MADDDLTEVPQSSDNLTTEITLMDPNYLALLTERFGAEDQRSGTLWNFFMYGVEYNPNEEVFTDPDGNIVEGGPMIPNPDYVPAGEETTAPNPEYKRWERLRPDEKERTPEPPREITVPGTPAQGEEFIEDPSVTLTPTTRGAVMGYDPNIISESELIQMNIQAEGGLVDQRTTAEAGRIEEDIATSGLGTATAESALRLLPEQEQNELLRIGAENAGYDLTKADAESQLRLLPEEERTRLMALGAEQSGYDLTKASNEMGLRLLPEQEKSLSAGFKADTAKAELSEDESRRAQEIIAYGKEMGLDEAQIDAQLAEAGFTKAKADYAKELLGYRKSTGVDTAAINLEKQQIGDTSTALTQKGGLRESLYNKLQTGLDVDQQAKQAAADASQAYDKSKEGQFASLALRGINPDKTTDDSMNRASLISTAKTKARDDAGQTNIKNLTTGLQVF